MSRGLAAHGLPILPGGQQQTTLGVVGGGQLGRMFVHAAQGLGYRTAVLDPDAQSPAGLVSHVHLKADYLDAAALATLAQQCAAITTEFENVPAAALRTLAGTRVVAPAAEAVAIAQDRVAEKTHFMRCAAQSGVRCAPYAVIESPQQVVDADAHLFPGILKTARMGYDGKGQVRVADRASLALAWAQLGSVCCVLEQQLDLQAEYSVILARGADGQMVHFPVQRNTHQGGILALTEVHESNMAPALAQQAVAAAQAIAKSVDYVGVLCVEFFLVKDAAGQMALVVNEMAPRPHNSGHYTLDACDVSQFDLQVRALAGLPLVQPRQHSPAIMLNLLGDLWFASPDAAEPVTPPWHQVLAIPGAHLHLYGKQRASRGRKMGHLTFTAASLAQVQASARQACGVLGLAVL